MMNVAAGLLDPNELSIVIQSVIRQTQELNLPIMSVGKISNDILNLIGKREDDLISQQNWYLTLGKGFAYLAQLNHGNENGIEVEVEEVRHTVFVYCVIFVR